MASSTAKLETGEIIHIDELVNARRRCIMAGFPSWLGRLPAALLAIVAAFDGIVSLALYGAMACAVFAGYRLMVEGRVAGGLLQLAGIGGLTVGYVRFMFRLRETIAASSRVSLVSMTGVGIFVGIVTAFLVWGILETVRCRRIAARHPLAASAVRNPASLRERLESLGYRRIKRASLTTLLGIAIAIPALALSVLLLTRLDTLIEYSTSAQIAGGLAWFVLIYQAGKWSQRLFFKARRIAAMPAEAVLRMDDRPASLLLRSFADDLKPLAPGYYIGKDYAANSILLSPEQLTLEEILSQVLSEFGPVVAIGKPGEELPPIGAARQYLPADRWQDSVSQHLLQARWIAIVLGRTEGLTAELVRIRELSLIERVIVIFPPVGAAELATRWRAFTAAVFDAAATIDVGHLLVAIVPDGRRPTYIACTERDAHCYEFAVRRALGILNGQPVMSENSSHPQAAR